MVVCCGWCCMYGVLGNKTGKMRKEPREFPSPIGEVNYSTWKFKKIINSSPVRRVRFTRNHPFQFHKIIYFNCYINYYYIEYYYISLHPIFQYCYSPHTVDLFVWKSLCTFFIYCIILENVPQFCRSMKVYKRMLISSYPQQGIQVAIFPNKYFGSHSKLKAKDFRLNKDERHCFQIS